MRLRRPAYVLVAKAFTLLVPIGTEAFRVNLFSLVSGVPQFVGTGRVSRGAFCLEIGGIDCR
jgi:hypothetical protein